MRYGKGLIFQDVDDIKPGEDFLETIGAHLVSSQVFLILIPPHWLMDAHGRGRLDDPQDVLRMEVTEGLSSEGAVIPVLVGKAHVPSPQELPEPLKPLSRRQAVKLRDEEWPADVRALMTRPSKLILPTGQGTSLPTVHAELYKMQQK